MEAKLSRPAQAGSAPAEDLGGRHERVVPPPALAASAALGDALDLVACGHELVRALQGSAARVRRADERAGS